jgi:hypothetical protein
MRSVGGGALAPSARRSPSPALIEIDLPPRPAEIERQMGLDGEESKMRPRTGRRETRPGGGVTRNHTGRS